MTQVTLELPEAEWDFARRASAELGQQPNEFLAILLREEQERRAAEEIEPLLVAALGSPCVPVTPELSADLKAWYRGRDRGDG